MNAGRIEEIADAVLYEGYLLYPYRASAVKNRQRWNFGVLYPRAFAEAQGGADRWDMQTECVAQTAGAAARLSVRVRFLQPTMSQEPAEREIEMGSIDLAEIASRPMRQTFEFPKYERLGDARGSATIEIEGDDLGNGLFKIRVRVFNASGARGASREEALMRSLVSAHTILRLSDGEFISLLDPPDEAARDCLRVPKFGNLAGAGR